MFNNNHIEMRIPLKKIMAVAIFVGQLLVSYGQTNNSEMTTGSLSDEINPGFDLKTKLESLESQISNLQKTLDEVQKTVVRDTITPFSVGTFTLFSTDNISVYYFPPSSIQKKVDCNICDPIRLISRRRSIPWFWLYKCKEKRPACFKIDISKVIVEISEGVISDIQVLTKDNKVFTNGLAPIEVNRFNERCDLLKFFDGNNNFYIQTCDFMRWIRNGNYTPNDIRFELLKQDDSITLIKDVGLNSIFSIKLYSDMLSVFGNEPNGLVQTEANFKTPLISSNTFNKPFFLLNYFTANLELSRFDNDFKYTDVIVDDSDTVFSRQTLHQRNWFNFNVGFNLFSGQFSNKSKSRYALDLISGLALSNFAGTSDSLTIGLPYFGITPSIKIVAAPNLGIILSSQIIWQYSPQLMERGYGQEKKIISPGFEMYWNPLSSPGNIIFARARYVTMYGVSNPFWNFQIGYSLSLSEIINNKLENR